MTAANHPHGPIISPDFHISALEQAGGVMSLLAAAAMAGTAGSLWRRKPAWLALAGASLSALAGVLWMFRNPGRSTAGGLRLAVAPCDGEVRSITRVQEPRFLKAAAHRVTIKVRPGDVQVTRAPVEGMVRYRRYQLRGQSGQRDDALWIGLRQPDGAKVLVKLTASPFWRAIPPFIGRRITALLDLEDAAAQGQVTGHLPFGGQIEVFVPATSQIAVRPGTLVRAGETTLARL